LTKPNVTTSQRKHRVAVLGATGAVGQSFIRLLQGHPWFELSALAASERSAGRSYADAARWVSDTPMPEEIAGRMIVACDPSAVDAEIVFSALDSSVAGEVERNFAEAGRFVLSNAKNHRMDEDVPLVIAEVNPEHLELLAFQRERRGWSGAIVTNANCATIAATVPLAPLHQRFGIRRVFMATMQAVSGAGYPGVPSLDILGNVIPFIKDEEGKIETESQKMLGRVEGGRIVHAGFAVSAHANRVAVENGHTVCISVEFESPVEAHQAEQVMREWRGAKAARGLPSTPELPIVVTDAPDRPQPRRDVEAGRGMAVTVGRVRPDPLFHVKFVALGHNTVRGAAGASVQNAELLVRSGLVASR
jgi:aspartate-semialdehyde dehydrogenase